jgi:hypothetical protein
LFPVFGPADQQSEERAIRLAKAQATRHVGVIAWSREANPLSASTARRRDCFRAVNCPIWNSEQRD